MTAEPANTEEALEEVSRLHDVMDNYSDELETFLKERTDRSFVNWLRVYGMPDTPAEVYALIQSLYSYTLAMAVSEGFAALKAKGCAPTDEVEKKRAERKDQDERLKQVTEMLQGGQVTTAGDDGTFLQQSLGGYI